MPQVSSRPGLILTIGAINVSLPHNDRRSGLKGGIDRDLNTGFDCGLVAQLVRAHA